MRGRLILVAALGAACFAATPSNAQACYDSAIRSPSPFMGTHNEVFRLQDGTLWQVQHEYEYLYEYFPAVVICPARGFLIIDDKRLNIRQLDRAIESQIDGEFSGWEGDTVFRLTNGQIWQQADYDYDYHYAYSPDVLIFLADGRYMMQVEGMSEPIAVIRLR